MIAVHSSQGVLIHHQYQPDLRDRRKKKDNIVKGEFNFTTVLFNLLYCTSILKRKHVRKTAVEHCGHS